jgi:hypothetical protein
MKLPPYSNTATYILVIGVSQNGWLCHLEVPWGSLAWGTDVETKVTSRSLFSLSKFTFQYGESSLYYLRDLGKVNTSYSSHPVF